jgi:hypothetical protein
MAFPAIQRRRRSSAALAPPGARLRSPGGAGVVTGLPLVLLRSEGVALLALAIVLYGRSGWSGSPTSAWTARSAWDCSIRTDPVAPT